MKKYLSIAILIIIIMKIITMPVYAENEVINVKAKVAYNKV